MEQTDNQRDMYIGIISIVLSSGFVLCAFLLAPIALITVLWCTICSKKYACIYSPVCKQALQRGSCDRNCTLLRLICRLSCWEIEEITQISEIERSANSNSSPLGSIDRDIADIAVPKYDELSVVDELPSYLQACHVKV